MELDTNPTKPTKCVRLIENSDLPRVDCIYIYINLIVINILVIARMTLLICYTNYYGAHVFFLPGAHSMLKPALIVIYYY